MLCVSARAVEPSRGSVHSDRPPIPQLAPSNMRRRLVGQSLGASSGLGGTQPKRAYGTESGWRRASDGVTGRGHLRRTVLLAVHPRPERCAFRSS
jgi:hypothetical protein